MDLALQRPEVVDCRIGDDTRKAVLVAELDGPHLHYVDVYHLLGREHVGVLAHTAPRIALSILRITQTDGVPAFRLQTLFA